MSWQHKEKPYIFLLHEEANEFSAVLKAKFSIENRKRYQSHTNRTGARRVLWAGDL